MADENNKSCELEQRNASRRGRNTGIVLGVLGTLAAGVIFKKTTGKNIIDGSEQLYDRGKNYIASKISTARGKKLTSSPSSSNE